MITSSELGVRGRLGNQIFQYAFIFSIAKKFGYDYCIPYNTDLEKCFNLSCRIENFKANNHYGIGGPMEFQEHILKTAKDDCDYVGYFQTSKYFDNIKNELLKELIFKPEHTRINNRNYDNIVSINVRRGDYLTNPSHPVIDLNYINRAKLYFPNKKFLAISDDIEWCKSNNIADYYDSNQNYYQSLYELSLCSGSIISNSTFSWWGAYLGRDKEKVIAPKLWFTGDWAGADWSNIYCKNWIII